jgi:hypothetical protein
MGASVFEYLLDLTYSIHSVCLSSIATKCTRKMAAQFDASRTLRCVELANIRHSVAKGQSSLKDVLAYKQLPVLMVSVHLVDPL